MSKKVIKPIVLVMVFIVSVILFCITTNKGNSDMTIDMSDASLPVVSFMKGDMRINELRGYTQKMDAVLMRDSIIPIDTKRQLSMYVMTYGKAVDAIAYEIRSIDGERLVVDEKIKDFTASSEAVKADFTVPNVLENNQEYLVIFTLESGADSINYYSRIMQTADTNVDETLEFALDFHNNTLSGSGKDFFPTYMDATTGDRKTLDYVDLTSTLKQITWGDFKGEQYMQPSISFKEINDSYNVVVLEYVMSRVNEKGETIYYNVEEYFRLRQTPTRMYVLNYERTTNQIFNCENTFLTDSGNIMLGIRNSEVEYKTNEASNIVCLVQEGDLYSYDVNNNEIIKIFSFRGNEGIDARENWNRHDIKIVKVDEAGSVDFVVYGYMNRGEHEGEVGTAVYHYDGLAHTIEEEAFIPSRSSYEVLSAEMGRLLYINEKNELYLLMEENLYKINLTTSKTEKLVENLETGCYAASESNQFFSWVEPDLRYSSNIIKLMDLKTGEIKEIKRGSDQFLCPLGFLENDFIYGVANTTDVVSDVAGNTTFPMHSIIIVDTTDGKELKNYSPAHGYVEKISLQNYTIEVDLIVQEGGAYVEAGTDSIMNREADSDTKVYLATDTDDEMMTTKRIVVPGKKSNEKLKFITAQHTLRESDTTADLVMDNNIERFYVYVKGDVMLATDSISDAIMVANDNMGVVLDANQKYVWMRARKTSVNAFGGIAANEIDKGSDAVVKSLSAMLNYNDVTVSVQQLIDSGSSAVEILTANLTDKVILDLQGVSTEEIIFYVSQGNPVFAMTGNGSAVLVIGYSSTGRLYYYNPSTDSVESADYESADKMFYNGGLHFVTYMD